MRFATAGVAASEEDRMAYEGRARVIRQTEEQKQELRRLLDARKLSALDQGKLRALAQHAPAREHQEALDKLQRIADRRRARRESQPGDADKSVAGLW
jgi:hypothetical protein